MQFIEDEILAGELIPVLLGTSNEANATARRIFRRFRLVSHLFCEKKPPLFGMNFCTKYHIVRHSASDEIMLGALLDFSGQLRDADVVYYLIPCTDEYAKFVWRHRTELESYYVVADEKEMQKVWYGEEYEI